LVGSLGHDLPLSQDQNVKTTLFCAALLLCCSWPSLTAGEELGTPLEPSHFKLTTANGLIMAVYNTKENRIDEVFPHVFALYDSGNYVQPFVRSLSLNSPERPASAGYEKNTHVITARYGEFTVSYLSSFTKGDIIFYVVVRGGKEKIENISCTAESGRGRPARRLLAGSTLRKYSGTVYEKYLLYSFVDSLHTDTTVVQRALAGLAKSKTSLVDDEVHHMQKVFSRCTLPGNLSARERNVAEQSITVLKMSQVSDREVLPFSRGQVLASLRPGLWNMAWVRDGSYALQAMTRVGLLAEARKGLEFMLKAPSGKFKHYVYKDGIDYGPGVDYQISLTRYFGNGEEECDYNEYGPNIEYDDFGLFLCAFTDYIQRSNDSVFFKRWNPMVCSKVGDAIISCIDTNSLIKADSGPWEHHLLSPKQYTFTSGVCARGLELLASLQRHFHLPSAKYAAAASRLKQGILSHMLRDPGYLKGNASDQRETDPEYYDSGVFEIFANGLIQDNRLFSSHMDAYDRVMRIKGERTGYIRLNTTDPYENQEWVFINLRVALAHCLLGKRTEAAALLDFVTDQAAVNNNVIPEMYSNKMQMAKVSENLKSWEDWCNCIRDRDDQYIGQIPMVGYGSGAYILTLCAYYGK
jgi:hypothetical protein